LSDLLIEIENNKNYIKSDNFYIKKTNNSAQIIFEKFFIRAQYIIGLILLNINNDIINIEIITGGGNSLDAGTRIDFNLDLYNFIKYIIEKNNWAIL